MLDHHNGDAAVGDGADRRHHGDELGWIESGQNFVEQQEAGFCRQRAGKLQPLSPGDRQARGGLVQQFGETNHLRNLRGRIARRRARAPRQVRADRNILVHGQPGKWPYDLERAGDAAPRQPVRGNAGNILAAVTNAAAARRQKSADHREQGRLAGAVRSDQSGDAPGLDIERDIIHGQQSAEAFADTIDAKQRLSHETAPVARISGQ